MAEPPSTKVAVVTGGASGIGLGNACAFLVSDAAGYITGQAIGVNDGQNTRKR
jgi:NAD(P)-dependent dehydrogenase (short-subunit alcohol dehydrogenase family)